MNNLLYKEVKEGLVQTLAAGRWTVGEKLPPEAALAKEYHAGDALNWPRIERHSGESGLAHSSHLKSSLQY